MDGTRKVSYRGLEWVLGGSVLQCVITVVQHGEPIMMRGCTWEVAEEASRLFHVMFV